MIPAALLETVAARAADTEAQRRLPADLAAELAQAGLFRMLVPKSLGGGEGKPARASSSSARR
jgi:alkylation response protein AidB-like acyl-CoA dehydrogenase